MQNNSFSFKENLLIIGNQAADLDSSVSAFALASLLRRLNPEISVHPIIQGSHSDLKLKPEIKELFQKAGIVLKPENFSSVFFDTNSELYNSKADKKSSIVMVDHNEVDLKGISHDVLGIVDHHLDSLIFPDLKLRDIRICGSCASIISEYWEQLDREIPYDISLLLCGAIAVDTGYLDQSWGKTTELDHRQYETLIRSLKTEDRQFIENLLYIKNDLSHLNLKDQLRRDYKDFFMDGLTGGISSIPMGQNAFFDSSFYEKDAVINFSRQNCPDFLIIMHTIPQPFKRELSLYIDTANKGIKRIIIKALLQLEIAGLELIDSNDIISGSNDNWTTYSQKNVKVSRKVMVPLLKEELEKQLKTRKIHPGRQQER